MPGCDAMLSACNCKYVIKIFSWACDFFIIRRQSGRGTINSSCIMQTCMCVRMTNVYMMSLPAHGHHRIGALHTLLSDKSVKTA